MSAAARKHVVVMEVPADCDFNAKIRTNSPSGSLILEDVRYTGRQREVVSEVALNYELRANAEVSISQIGSRHQLSVDFNFEFRCWLSGAVTASGTPCAAEVPIASRGFEGFAKPAGLAWDHAPVKSASPPGYNAFPRPTGTSYEKQADAGNHSQAAAGVQSNPPGDVSPCCVEGRSHSQRMPKTYVTSSHRLSYSSSNAMNSLDATNQELSYLESRVGDIASMVADACAHDVSPLRSELAQLETRAKQLETNGIDDVYTGELHSGKQMAKSAKKDLLSRLEQLFDKFDKTFAAMTAKAT
jgi:hypothetical protein